MNALLNVAKYTYDRYCYTFLLLMTPSLLIAFIASKGFPVPSTMVLTIQTLSIIAICAWCAVGLSTTRQFAITALASVLLVISVGSYLSESPNNDFLISACAVTVAFKLYLSRFYITQLIFMKEHSFIIQQYNNGQGFFPIHEKFGLTGYRYQRVDFTTIGEPYPVFCTLEDAKKALLKLDKAKHQFQ